MFYLCNRFDANQSMSILGYHDAVDTCNPNESYCSAARPIRRMVRKLPNRYQFWYESMVDCRLFNVYVMWNRNWCKKKVQHCSRRLKRVKNAGVWASRPEKLVSSVVEMHCGNRGAHKPLEHNNLVSPSNLYNPKSLQRAWSEWPCGTSHPTFFYFVVTKIKTKS